MGFLGGLFKEILSPLTNWIFSWFYGFLIRGPLTWLNYEDKAFQYASGAQVDKLLFNTTLVDGKPQLNFFTSDSPLKYFFMITLACAGALLAVFISFSIIHAATGKKGKLFKKIGTTFFSGSMVFILPMLFLTALSLMGSLISTMGGQHNSISNKNIIAYRQNLSQALKSLKSMNAKDFANKNIKIKNVLEYKNNKNTTYSINDIYSNLQNLENWEINEGDPIKNLAQSGQSIYFEIQDAIYNISDNKKNKDYIKNINVIESALNSLSPGKKDEKISDKLKDIKFKLMELNKKIHLWQDNALSILKYKSDKKPSKMQPNELAIYNFEIMYNNIWGIENTNKHKEFQTINNLYQYLEVSNRLLTGSSKSPNVSLISLIQILSNYKDSTLVVTFYQMVTGNKDSNWDQSFSELKNGGIMIFVGCIIIIIAMGLLGIALLNAMSRIFSLALLFIVSPMPLVLSPLDDGKRMKGWIKATTAKMTSIIGIIIIFRLFGALHSSFQTLLNNNAAFVGNTGYMLILILMTAFSIGGLFAANKGSQTISSIIGAGYGIMEGLQAGQAMNMLKGMGKLAKTVVTGGIGGMVTAASMGALNKNKRKAIYANARSRLGSLRNATTSGIAQSAKTVTLATASKMGSKRAKLSLANTKRAQAQQKVDKLSNKSLTNKLGGNLAPKNLEKRSRKLSNAKERLETASTNQKTALNQYNKKKGRK